MKQNSPPLPTIRSFFSEKGLLKKKLPTYERRPEQEEMATGIGETLKDGKNFIVEAGTGTGKSFAYLVPSILWAIKNKKRVCVSTFTKALQQQLIEKDLPFISKILGVDFNYALCLGGNNYLCKRRMRNSNQLGLFSHVDELRQLDSLCEWEKTTGTGSRLDLPFQPRPSVWEEVGRQAELCLGKNCSLSGKCFYNMARRKWMAAHILVVNHHLFFANLASNGSVLPQFHAVVFDEAHNIEDVATSYLGTEVTNSGMWYTLDRLHNPKNDKGFVNRVSGVQNKLLESIRNLSSELRDKCELFFSELSMMYGNSPGVFRLNKPNFIDALLSRPIKILTNELKELKEHVKDKDEAHLVASYFAGRFEEFGIDLNSLITQSLNEHVYWFECSQMKRYKKMALKACPIEVSEILKRTLFQKDEPIILTSATLSTNRNFRFISDRLGLEKPRQALFPSTFNFERQALLYTARDLPDPSSDPEKFSRSSTQRIKELLDAGSGRAFVLFTSYSMLNRVYKELSSSNLPWTLIKQGEMPQSQAIKFFKEDKSSVLLGTNTFWEGVDVPGEALQSVIIARLPFSVPTDPLVEARIERLKAAGKSPFFEFQVPRAIVMLKQGFGRLIRHKEDMGMVAILDPRLHTKGYGKMFFNSLPKCMETSDMDEVRRFFREIRK